MNHTTTRLAILFVALLAAEGARAAQMPMSAAMQELLNSSRSTLRFEADDDLRRQMQLAGGPPSKLLAQLTTLAILREAGCKRVEMQVSAPEVLVIDKATGRKGPFTTKMTMNICQDMHPPKTADGALPK